MELTMLLFIVASLFASAALVYLLLLLSTADTRDRKLISFFNLCVVVLLWTFLNLLTSVVTPEYFTFVHNLKIIVVFVLPYVTCTFFLTLVQFKFVETKAFKIFVTAVPVIDILVLITNPFHWLMYTSYDYPSFEQGPFFVVHLAFATGTIMFSYFVVLRYLIKNFRHKPMMIIIGACAILPFFQNMLYIFDLTNFTWDTTPLGYFAAVILFAYAAINSQVFHFRQETLTGMFNVVTQIIVTVNKQGFIVDANASAAKAFPAFKPVFGETHVGEYIDYLKKSTVSCEPSDAFEKVLDFRGDKGEITVGNIQINMPYGELKTFTLHQLSIMRDDSVLNYAVSLVDVSDYFLMMNEIERRSDLLNVINQVAVVLSLSQEGLFEESLQLGMELIGQSSDADFVQIWQNEIIDGKLHYVLRHAWFSDAGRQMRLTPIGAAVLYPKSWVSLFRRNECINGPVSVLSKEDGEILSAFGLKSTATIPLFSEDEFWGIFCIDDCKNERFYSEDEIGILRSAGLMLVNTINRYEQSFKIRKAEEMTRLTLDSTPLSCQLWNRDFKIIDCNEKMVKLFGFKNKKDCIERQSVIYPDFQPDGLRSVDLRTTYLKRAFETGHCTLDWVYKMFDGSLMPAEVTLVRIKHNDGDVIAVYSRDLREEKAAEKKLLESIERENDLEIQRQVAQAASNAKSQFLANMSHEIRTPMNAIIGMSDLLLSEHLNARQHRFVEDIKISSNALLDIINDILDFSKIQSSKLILSPIHYDLKSLINNINSMVYFLIADRKKLDFEVYIQDELPAYLYGDDVRLRQILLNLLSNAIKFTRKGRVKLSFLIAESSIDDESTSLLISVADTGTGIPADAIPTLFDAFEQADMQINRYQQGTGLGLAITKALVERMGGSISVESEYGKGTTFNLLLPLIPGDKNLINKDTGFESGIIYAPEAKVLVVDDRETNITVINGLLNQCQIDADSAISGANAIRMTERKSYDLIFMDHMMPEMDGAETTKILRESGISIPIVALTANAVTGAKELLLSSGMNDFLSKPIDKSELYRILSTWLPQDLISGTPVKKETAVLPTREESEKNFWDNINGIENLSVEKGLEFAAGQQTVYKNALEICTREIKKSVKSLVTLLENKDMKEFCTDAHGIKGSLSFIGESELSAKALKLEQASRAEDIGYCAQDLPEFIDGLTAFSAKLTAAFDEYQKSQPPLNIPKNLPPILDKITTAIEQEDLTALFELNKSLDALNLSGTLKEETEKLKSAIIIMNYDYATEIIERMK